MQQLRLRLLLPLLTKLPQVGAFYTDGEIGDRGNKGDNFWSGRGSRIINNTFINIRTDYPGSKGDLAVQAVYLDDMISGYEVASNRFVNCSVGSFVGGGRDNFVHDNYYENCELAQHFDNVRTGSLEFVHRVAGLNSIVVFFSVA